MVLLDDIRLRKRIAFLLLFLKAGPDQKQWVLGRKILRVLLLVIFTICFVSTFSCGCVLHLDVDWLHSNHCSEAEVFEKWSEANFPSACSNL